MTTEEVDIVGRSLLHIYLKARQVVLEAINCLSTNVNKVKLRSSQLREELEETLVQLAEFNLKHGDIQQLMLKLVDDSLELKTLHERCEILHSELNLKQEKGGSRSEESNKMLACQREICVIDFCKKVEEMKQQSKNELSTMQLQLASEIDSNHNILDEQQHKYALELELLKETASKELEQEKELAHINCRSKIRDLRNQIAELEERIDNLPKAATVF